MKPDGLLPTYAPLPVRAARGRGCWIVDDRGRRYLDMYGGHAVASTGHCHPEVVRAIRRQASNLIFYSTALGEVTRERAARLLAASAPAGLRHAVFVNSGAEAVENAVKIAVLQTGRTGVIAMEGSFHGRTLLALNLTHAPKYRCTAPYAVESVRFQPFGVPPEPDRTTACVVLEPIQSMAGVRVADRRFLVETARRCRRAGALLIFDEVQTGVGRTGRMFFAGLHGVVPDMICLAKGLASGVPAGAVLVSRAIASRITEGQLGSTFGGCPLAMAAMEATLRVVRRPGFLANVRRRGAELARGLRGLAREVRGMGLLLGVVFDRPAKEVRDRLLQERILTGTSDDPSVLRLLPPLVIGKREVAYFLAAVRRVLS